jgi:hypothetical protein
MNHKRTRVFICATAAALLSVSFLGTGCVGPNSGTAGGTVTNTTPSINVARAANAVDIAAESGAIYLLSKKPEARPYLIVAVDAINSAIGAKAIDPQVLRESLAQLVDSEDPDVWIAITAGLNIYRLYVGDIVARGIDPNGYALPVLTALSAGMLRGINTVPPPPAQSVLTHNVLITQ